MCPIKCWRSVWKGTLDCCSARLVINLKLAIIIETSNRPCERVCDNYIQEGVCLYRRYTLYLCLYGVEVNAIFSCKLWYTCTVEILKFLYNKCGFCCFFIPNLIAQAVACVFVYFHSVWKIYLTPSVRLSRVKGKTSMLRGLTNIKVMSLRKDEITWIIIVWPCLI